MRAIWVLVLGVVYMTLSFGGEIVFIVSEDFPVSKVSAGELRDVYLKEREFLGGIPVIPVNLPSDNELRKRVERELLGMDREKLQLFWNRKYLSGVDPPIVLLSERAVKEFVRRVKGAVGYIRRSNLEKGFRVIFELR